MRSLARGARPRVVESGRLRNQPEGQEQSHEAALSCPPSPTPGLSCLLPRDEPS